MPFEKPFHRQVFHFHGQPQVAIAFAEICPEKLINRGKPNTAEGVLPTGIGSKNAPPKGTWKPPLPAGSGRNAKPRFEPQDETMPSLA